MSTCLFETVLLHVGFFMCQALEHQMFFVKNFINASELGSRLQAIYIES
jgi:hypothetical protein